MGDFKNLAVYQKAFSLAMNIFELTKYFPVEEKFSLISQIRKSSRSVCANIAEAYRKRQYPAHFRSKISDADMENSETQVWLNFSLACSYISNQNFEDLLNKSLEIGRLLSHMIQNPTKYKTT
ncbi:MAG: four helix bundle protein [Caldithrix sp. RBG_13_44_9]|nr:MAG: four helix bundle protein [Caldithrix sp. RBG_13_44_9]